MPLSGALDDQQIELKWGEDRAALRACGNQLRALVGWRQAMLDANRR